MKFFYNLACVLAVGQTALAAPAPAPDATTTDLFDLHTTRAIEPFQGDIEKRINCATIKQNIKKIGTSNFIVMFTTAAIHLAGDICRLNGGTNCYELENIILKAFLLVFAFTSVLTSGAVPETLPTKRDGDDDFHAIFARLWEDASDGKEYSYRDIASLPFNTTDADLQRRGDEPRLLSRVLISGITSRDVNSTASHDIVANHYEGGDTILHVPITPSSGANGKRDELAKAPGFKISFTTRLKSLLTQAHQNDMSTAAASYWAALAETTSMTDMIGFAEAGTSANFYYRIIPEVDNFGLNYESVDICGGMGSYLDDF